ncbi:hypothetical protein Lupro_11110 [Lutibacter profundi]|uniref:HMA domain-containing protein n=1 Tax=Lutibacter profundi TaxID=1622118 RepID=A0A120IEI6_9FLAO|nr:heavy-metal-associated domain-containing protein [Lutibacter profundi]AMC11784.1 hypothetical protein Lupro_11110 [Lutibacter profundi]
MKNIVKKIIVLMLLISNLGVVQAEVKIKKLNQTGTYIKIWVDGLACPFCAYGLEKQIKRIEGVKNLHIDLNRGFITFTAISEKKPTEERLKKLVKEAGFVARKIEYSKTDFVLNEN